MQTRPANLEGTGEISMRRLVNIAMRSAAASLRDMAERRLVYGCASRGPKRRRDECRQPNPRMPDMVDAHNVAVESEHIIRDDDRLRYGFLGNPIRTDLAELTGISCSTGVQAKQSGVLSNVATRRLASMS